MNDALLNATKANDLVTFSFTFTLKIVFFRTLLPLGNSVLQTHLVPYSVHFDKTGEDDVTWSPTSVVVFGWM